MGIHKVVLGSLRAVVVACVAATSLVLSACATDGTLHESETSHQQAEAPQQPIEVPSEKTIKLATDGLKGFVSNFTSLPASEATRKMLPEEIQARDLLEPTGEARTGAGIIAGEFPGTTCGVLYLVSAREGLVRMAIATADKGILQQRVLEDVSGQEVAYYISKYCQ